MSKKTHIKTNTHKILLAIIFILVIGFGFGKGEKAEAWADCEITCEGKEKTSPDDEEYTTAEQCVSWCKNAKPSFCPNTNKIGYRCYFKDGIVDEILGADDAHTEASENAIEQEQKNSATSCSGIGEWGGHPVDCALLLLLNFFIWLMQLASTLFGWIMVPDNITTILSSKAIYQSWALVRDALNVSFIMFLLFSAFATVFQIDKYSYKKTLLTIVIMALLVNFSFPISRFIIDVSNMMMFYFVSVLDIDTKNGAIMTNFASAAELPRILHTNLGSVGTALLAATIFVFIFTVTILTISILFLIRTIALAILIVFSSLAFVGTAIPPLASYASDWWKKLFSYAFFGPVMLFMMYIASSLMNEIGRSGTEAMQKIATANTAIPELIASISFFSIPIVLLWMGLGVAQSMSIAGAGAIVGKAQGFMKGTGKWLGHKADRGLASTGRSKNKFIRPLQYLSPTALKTAWKQREDELDKKAFGPATGNWRDTLNRFWTVNPKKWMNRQSRHGEAAIQSLVAQYEKDAESVSTDFAYIYGEYKMAEKSKDKEKMAAMLRIIAKTNEFNSFSKAEGFVMDPFELKRELFKRLKKVGMQESEAGKHISDMGEIAYGKGNYQLYGMSAIDEKGNYAETSDEKQIELSRGKAKNIKAQTKTDLWHWNSFLQQDTNGNAGKLHRFGEIQLEQLNTAVLDQLNRVRDDFFDGLITQVDAIDNYASKIDTGMPKVAATATTPEIPEVKANPEQAKIIREFANRIRERKGKDPIGDPKDRIRKG